MPSLDWNRRVWSDYAWPQHGEEWSAEMAVASGMTPDAWKDSVVREFLIPHLRKDKVVLEIGPGHGRWSKIIVPRSEHVYLVDLNRSCLDFLRELFKDCDHVALAVPNCEGGVFADYGVLSHMDWSPAKAPAKPVGGIIEIRDESIDFVFSFDTFVHIEEPETRAYIKEFARVLKRQTMSVIHHAGNPTAEQRARGCRSQVTQKLLSKILVENGLVVIRQTDTWGEKSNVKLNSDCVTVFIKP